MIDLRIGNGLFNGTQPCRDCLFSNRTENHQSADSQLSSPAQTVTPLLDTHGYHAATSKHAMGATRRHNRIRDLIKVILRDPAIALRPQIEWSFPSQNTLPPQSRERLDMVIDDVAFKDVVQGYDFTIVSPHNKSHLAEAARAAAGAARKSEHNKVRKYGQLCLENDVAFTPIGMDIHSAMAPQAKRAFKQIADFAAARKGTAPSTEYRRITLRVVSTALQLTATAVNRRMTNIHTGTIDACQHNQQ